MSQGNTNIPPAPGAAALGDDTYDGGQAPGPEPEA